MFAVLGLEDYLVIGFIVAVLASSSAAWARLKPSEGYRLRRLEWKLDLILKHLGIDYADAMNPGGLSEEVRSLADDPKTKIQAIKLHREQTGVGLLEAKEAVEAYMNGPK